MNLGLRERKKERERNKRERVITSEKGKERAKILGQYLGCLFYAAKKISETFNQKEFYFY